MGKWLKNVSGETKSKSTSSKGKEGGKGVVVTTKVEESDVVSDLPSFAIVEPEDISDDDIEVHEGKPTDAQNVVPIQDNVVSDAERIQQEIAATSVQAVFRGYLVRRQAVATLFSVMGIVRLQAFARGKEIRKSDIGVQVHRKCRIQLLQGNKLANSADAYLGIKKLTSNAFALKLLASSPKVIPVHAYGSSNPNSNLIWLENWSASCFWKPVPQPKKIGKKSLNKILVEAESAKPKKSLPATNSESSSVQTSFEFEKSNRSFRTISRQSIEPPAVAIDLQAADSLPAPNLMEVMNSREEYIVDELELIQRLETRADLIGDIRVRLNSFTEAAPNQFNPEIHPLMQLIDLLFQNERILQEYRDTVPSESLAEEYFFGPEWQTQLQSLAGVVGQLRLLVDHSPGDIDKGSSSCAAE